MKTDTPETDAAYSSRNGESVYEHLQRKRETMEMLERERDELREGFTLDGLNAAEKCCGDYKSAIIAERDALSAKLDRILKLTTHADTYWAIEEIRRLCDSGENVKDMRAEARPNPKQPNQ